MDCIFCRIINRELPAARIFEDSDVISFLDINPVNFGHTLVVPKRHYELLLDIPGVELGRVTKILPSIARAVMAATKADGLNVFQTNGPCAGQTVPHLHFHIIPRHTHDDFSFGWRQKKYRGDEMARMQTDIISALKNVGV
ncbi:MAG TPA: HIT family protein [Candidatus Brocadiia bacterium]|nr:HIT family protein [Planctomycetota bacterium]MDO8092435.1 HIT family protein [Candidatus Brocadiales bacterium]